MDSKWQRVYSTDQKYRAEIVRAVLEDQEMHPVIVDKQDQMYQVNSWGTVEIYVAPENVLRAMKIIRDDIRFE
jgi:hypothetical protein